MTFDMKAYQRQYYHRHKEKINARRKSIHFRRNVSFRSHLKQKYNLSLEQYDALVREQEGRCKLCNQPTPHLWVDHDHQTGKIRALLCPSCNSGLGFFREHPELLQRAVKYLQSDSPDLEATPDTL